MQRLSLAQQIAQLEDTAPADFDPEDTYDGLGAGKDNNETENDLDVEMDERDPSGGREHYVDVGPSELRKMRDSVADPKYDGVKTSRDQLIAAEFEEEEGQDREEPYGSPEAVLSSRINNSPSSESENDGDVNQRPASPLQNRDARASTNHSRLQELAAEVSRADQSLASSLKDTRTADRLKGKAVSRQLALWDSLVDARIRLQKSITTTNKLPHPNNIAPYVSNPTGRAAAQAFLSEAVQLWDELFELRHNLLSQTDLNVPPRKKRRIDSGTSETDYEALIGECTAEMVASDAATHADMLSTLQKWSSKVQAVAPSVLLPSSRVTFKGPTTVKSAAELVEEALQDQGKAIRRTWGKASRIGEATHADVGDEGDKETFDDRDFYQAMLRDVIESKGGRDGINAADLYVNSKKPKKSVDTKASKGRKLRYEPHEKLQHFMVPVPIRGAWHAEQIDELFASLLGKGFEQEVGADNPPKGKKERQVLEGFRVFG